MPPRISVVMIFFNSERYIKEAIDSVLVQTFTDFELLLVMMDRPTPAAPSLGTMWTGILPACAIWSTRGTPTAACPRRAI